MDKLTMAQDYIIAEVRRVGICSIDQDKIVDAWKVADAMQAEAKEREDKTRPDVLLTKDKDGKCLHFHHEFGHKKCMDCGASLEEWQPDWSQAPDDAIGWVMMQNHSYWHGDEGYLIEDAPSFGFTGSHIMERPNGF